MLTVLRGGTVIDPSQGIDGVLDVAIKDSKIQALGPNLPSMPDAREIDVRGKYVCPGLIDLHGHWYSGSMFGIDPELCLAHGVTTVVDAGTTGFVNFDSFRKNQIDKAQIEVLAFLNIAATGIPTILAGELEDIRMACPKETTEVLLCNSDKLVGVKLRTGVPCGQHSTTAFHCAIEAATAASVPLMVHVGEGSPTDFLLKHLRSGDILTHCFQNRGPSIVRDGALEPKAKEARDAGILFDVGHGCGSFRWDVARKAFEYEFYPDTISTDLHRYSIGRWAIDMPTTMSKFLHIGMALHDVILKSTWRPAQILGRERQLGTLKVGTVADIFVFDLEDGEFRFEDAHLAIETAEHRIRPNFVVRSGKLIYPNEVVRNLRPLSEADRNFLRFVEQTA